MKKIMFLCLIILLGLLAGCTDMGMKDGQKRAVQGDSTSFLRAHFIDVGQADATLLQIKHQDELMTILIDTGDWNRSDALQYLQKENIETIDLIAITHPHADHIGQLSKIIEAFDVGEVWMNGEIVNSQVFADALTAIEQKGIDYYEPTAGDTFDVGDVAIEIIHPDGLSLNTNNNSIVMRLQYGDISFLFTGDAEKAAEEKMLAGDADLSASILHLGHHGSNTSSTGNFLEAVRADTAIYSAGVNNSYGHPDAEIIERVKARNMDVYGTDEMGTIVLETDGQNVQIMTEKDDALPAPLLDKKCIDLNTASIDELQKLKHIGEKMANEVITARPFKSLDDLIHVKGIGESRLKEILDQNLACVGG